MTIGEYECVGGPLDGEVRSFECTSLTVAIPEFSPSGMKSHYYCLTISVWPQGSKTWWSYRGTDYTRISQHPVVEPAFE